MLILDQQELTHTEVALVAEAFSSPTVKKYLKHLGIDITTKILEGSPGPNQSDSEYIRSEAHYKGQLAVIETLLSIQQSKE